MERKKEYSDVRYGLLPCPFCGGHAFLEENSRGFVNGKTQLVAYVRCKKCNARSGRFLLPQFGCTSHSAGAVAAAINAWNNRVIEKGETNDDSVH